MKCDQTHCAALATKVPVLSFRSLLGGPTASATLSLHLCDAHANPDVEQYMTDNGWAQIEDTMSRLGLARPDRSTLAVSFQAIT